jgi:hypothetical protein
MDPARGHVASSRGVVLAIQIMGSRCSFRTLPRRRGAEVFASQLKAIHPPYGPITNRLPRPMTCAFRSAAFGSLATCRTLAAALGVIATPRHRRYPAHADRPVEQTALLGQRRPVGDRAASHSATSRWRPHEQAATGGRGDVCHHPQDPRCPPRHHCYGAVRAAHRGPRAGGGR